MYQRLVGGEQPLPPYGSCNLASINLNHEYFNDKGTFSFNALTYVVKQMVEYLDNVGSVNQFPTERHRQWYEENRPIGIGVMGLADVLLRYGYRYGSRESKIFVNEIFDYMYTTADYASQKLGKSRGIPKSNTELNRRNSTLLSIAPTGSIAVLADCSNGIEPVFSPAFVRKDERGQEYTYVHPKANEPYFVSAVGNQQATWQEQIDLVAICQSWIDSGVSKTINFPNSATVKDIKAAFVYAWNKGLKGITVYRDGSRNIQVLNSLPDENDSNECPTGVCEL